MTAIITKQNAKDRAFIGGNGDGGGVTPDDLKKYRLLTDLNYNNDTLALTSYVDEQIASIDTGGGESLKNYRKYKDLSYNTNDSKPAITFKQVNSSVYQILLVDETICIKCEFSNNKTDWLTFETPKEILYK